MPLHFLVPEAGSAHIGDRITIEGAEAHHAVAVRRVRPGEEITIGDGHGTWLTARCASAEPRHLVAEVLAREEVPAGTPRLVLVQALAKGDRDELAVQAATELGVDEIVPWQAARSVSRWTGPKAAKGRMRWETIVREAAKQAHRAWVSTVADAATTTEIAARAQASRVVVLEPTGARRLSSLDFDSADGRDVVLIVGPEGGIAAEELALFAAAGAEIAALGDTVLRTSTAGPAALAVVSTLLGRW